MLSLRRILKKNLLPLLAGAASVFAFAPFSVYWLAFVLLAILFVLFNQAEQPRVAGVAGFSFGLGFFGAGVSWIYVSLNVFGGMPMALAALSTLVFCAFLALFPALAGLLFAHLKTRRWIDLLLFAALIALTDWCRSWIFTGFPWLTWGYAQAPESLLAFYAPLFGVFGLSGLSALTGALLAAWAIDCRDYAGRKKDRVALRQLLVAPVLIGAMFLGGWFLQGKDWTTPSGEAIDVALIQGNIPQQIKWDRQHFYSTLVTYEKLIDQALSKARLVVLPETAFPAFYEDLPRSYLQHLEQRANAAGADLLFGVPTRKSGTDQYLNSAVSLGVSASQRYSKTHLVPFGEVTPPGFAWFMSRLDIPMSNFTAGPDSQLPLQLAGQKLAANICYEDVFGDAIAQTAPPASLMVNLSNTAWFGRSLAQAQHLQIARIRALESGRPMLRATNTGMTAIIDADGQIKTSLPPFTQDVLYGRIRGREGATPYMQWGDGLVAGFFMAWLCVGFFFRLKRKNQSISAEQQAV